MDRKDRLMKTLNLVKAAALAVGISALISGGAVAELAKPTGAVILTIGGALKMNPAGRGPCSTSPLNKRPVSHVLRIFVGIGPFH